MANPKVHVIEFTNDLSFHELSERVKLGACMILDQIHETRYNQLLTKMRTKASRAFLLIWTGGNIPRGAKILDYVIDWTQNGMAVGANGEDIGTYERLTVDGGESKKEQVMVVYLHPQPTS